MTYTKLLRGGLYGGLLGAGVWACAGEKIPFHSASDDQLIAAAYAGSANLPPGNGGSSGNAGSAGSSATQGGSGGDGGSSGSGNAGSGNLPGGSGGSGNSEVCNAPETIFLETCGGEASFCHGDGSANGDFAVSEANARALLDEASSSGANCGLFIDSGNIDESLILTKVTNEFDTNACQGQGLMPLGADPLSADEIACIESWLSQFAD